MKNQFINSESNSDMVDVDNFNNSNKDYNFNSRDYWSHKHIQNIQNMKLEEMSPKIGGFIKPERQSEMQDDGNTQEVCPIIKLEGRTCKIELI